MTRFTLITPLLLLAFVLAFVSDTSAGPSCARRNQGSDSCTTQCNGGWGYPGRVMGTNPWGQVMARSTSDISTVNRKACRARTQPSANATSSVSSLASPLIQTSLGAVNVGGALPSFSTASIASTKAPTTTQAASSLVVSSTEEPSSSISSTVTHSTSHIFAPVSSSRFATSLRSATSPSPSPTPKESSTTEKAETTPAAAPSSSPKPVTTAAPETTKEAAAPQVTTAAPASSGSDSATSSSDISAYLSAHNTIRAQHGASDLTWSDELASKAQQWANGCVFQHSGGSLGPFGENLAAGTGSSYDIAAAVKSWTDEVSEYNANNPVPSHFTQVVWKASTQVGCAVQSCGGIFAASFGLAKFFVCEYSPQGNVIGEFAQNVQV